MQKYWPILLVITANVAYNISAKQTPKDLNPFFALVITYGIAMLTSLALYIFSPTQGSVITELKKTDWSTIVFGLCVVALEFGYLNIYRVGWPINLASLVSNISLAVILLFVGSAFYREQITLRQLVGVAACVIGLILVSGKQKNVPIGTGWDG